jgi:predicted DNA-binding transcriptional regulator AlpA
MRLVDIAGYLGVTKQRAYQLADEPGFPRSRQHGAARIWRAEAIDRWAERRWWGMKPWRKPV